MGSHARRGDDSDWLRYMISGVDARQSPLAQEGLAFEFEERESWDQAPVDAYLGTVALRRLIACWFMYTHSKHILWRWGSGVNLGAMGTAIRSAYRMSHCMCTVKPVRWRKLEAHWIDREDNGLHQGVDRLHLGQHVLTKALEFLSEEDGWRG